VDLLELVHGHDNHVGGPVGWEEDGREAFGDERAAVVLAAPLPRGRARPRGGCGDGVIGWNDDEHRVGGGSLPGDFEYPPLHLAGPPQLARGADLTQNHETGKQRDFELRRDEVHCDKKPNPVSV
jgi:hypothetical protein